MQGIYKIKNKINDMAYIGQSIEIERRWIAHKRIAFSPNDSSYKYPLYQAIRKYGLDNFTFEVLEEVADARLLTGKEQYYFDLLGGVEKLYNLVDPMNWQTLYNGDAVYQIHPKTLKVMGEFQSISEAARSVYRHDKVLLRLLKGAGQKVAGYHWCYVKEWTPNWKPKSKEPISFDKKQVMQMDINSGEVIHMFDSMKDAARSITLDSQVQSRRRAIGKACSGIEPTAYGYKWRFANEVI
jgi:group I intron endonuclease